MSVLLTARDMRKAFGRHVLFDGLNLGVHEGDRIGFIGPNGAGKSTLLRVLAGLEPLDAGVVAPRRGLVCCLVGQDDVFPEHATLLQTVVAALPTTLDEHERETRASVTLARVGFPDPERPVDQLSGGWRRRLSMARGLAQEPDLLLLDEPTNHLDLEGIEWLEKLLLGARFATLVITHDRYFLDEVCTRIMEVNRAFPGGLFTVDGDYERFLAKRAEFLETQAAEEKALAGRVRKDIQWLKKGPKAQRCKAKSIIDSAGERRAELAVLQARTATSRSVGIDFSATGRQTVKLLVANGISKTLGDRPLFANLDVTLSPGSRLGLIGPNGSGKTSLIRVLTGELAPDAGTVKPADRLQVVTFSQHREELDPDITLREALSPHSDEVFYQGRKINVASWARRFLFRGEQLVQNVRELSGGEQSRIRIARLMLRPADLLVLDEPTNDLDIDSLEVLEEAMEEFPGALILVTHDRFMLERLATEMLALDGTGAWGCFADLSQWDAWRTARSEAARAVAKAAAKAARAPVVAKLSYQERKEHEQIEAKILAAEAEVARCEIASADPAIQHDYVRLADSHHALEQARGLVRRLYERWEELDAKDKASRS